jgi:hypothetical protein
VTIEHVRDAAIIPRPVGAASARSPTIATIYRTASMDYERKAHRIAQLYEEQGFPISWLLLDAADIDAMAR